MYFTNLLICFLLAFVCKIDGATSPTTASYLSANDNLRLKQVFDGAWDLKDLSAVHFATLGYKLLGEPVPKKAEVCAFLSSKAATTNAETLYYVGNAWKSIGTCPGTLPIANIAKALGEVVSRDSSTVSDLFYAVHGLDSIGQKKGDAAKLIKTLQAALKKDDSLQNLGYSFHIAAQLGTDGTFAFDRIEDAIVQADEVDSRFLQFEGGLSITALLVNGAYKLAETVKKPPPITADQAVKFANYFLSRRSVQTAKGACSLLEAVHTLADNKFHLPVAITLASQSAVSLEEPRVSVRVSNLLGKPLSPAALVVVAESATRLGDDVVVLSKKRFEPAPGGADPTVYAVNLMDSRPERGLYKLSVTAALGKPDARWAGNVGASLSVKVMCAVALDGADIGVSDADQTTQAKLTRVAHPSRLAAPLEADSLQKLVMKFVLRDKTTGKPMTVHQAFVQLSNADAKREITFVAEPDAATKGYKFDMDVGARSSDFDHLSGVYSVDLIVGDAVLSNSFSWRVAEVNLRFAEQAGGEGAAGAGAYERRPEIAHLFREAESRPPAAVSNLFTALLGVPLLVLIGMWIKIGANVSNFPLSLGAVGFHLGLGGIFVLYGIFWLQLNMFQTLNYLLAIALVTFLAGNKLLAGIASDRKQRH